MSITVYFSASFSSIVPIIQLISEQQSNQRYLIVVSNKAEYMVFEKLFDATNLLYIEPMPNIFYRNPIKLLISLIVTFNYKQKLVNRFASYNNCDIVTFSIAFAFEEFWLIRKLKSATTTHYKILSLDGFVHEQSFKTMWFSFLSSVFHGIQLDYLKHGERVIPSISFKFFIKYRIMQLPWVRSQLLTNGSVIEKRLGLELSEMQVLLVPQDVIMNGEVAELEYVRNMDLLIDHLNNFFGSESLCIKPHPLHFSLYGKEKSIHNAIPCFVPSEIIAAHFKVVIGYASASMISASNSGKKVISLLNYFKPINEALKSEYRLYLDKNSNGTIYYPHDLKEMEQIFVLTRQKDDSKAIC